MTGTCLGWDGHPVLQDGAAEVMIGKAFVGYISYGLGHGTKVGCRLSPSQWQCQREG
jgi:hypothetical protein